MGNTTVKVSSYSFVEPAIYQRSGPNVQQYRFNGLLTIAPFRSGDVDIRTGDFLVIYVPVAFEIVDRDNNPVFTVQSLKDRSGQVVANGFLISQGDYRCRFINTAIEGNTQIASNPSSFVNRITLSDPDLATHTVP